MPRYAFTDSGDPIHAQMASDEGTRTFNCPYCQSEMFTAGGENTQLRKHFRHPPDGSCYDYQSGDETQRHLDGKAEVEYLFLDSDWAGDVNVELDIGSTRPDVKATVAEFDIAVELQVSSITASELRERTRQRTAEGLYTLWMFDAGGRFRSETDSSSGNTYIQFKTAEQAYLSITGTDSSYIHYFDPSTYRSVYAQKYRLFDDKNGAWPEKRPNITKLETYTTESGFRLATVPGAVPEKTGDANQQRLF